MKLVIAEKPSVARAIYPVLGANDKKGGYMEGNGYIVSWCFGHLVGLCLPNDYGEKWSGQWSFSQLPMIPEKWLFKVNKDCNEQFGILKKLLNDKNVDEVICATDADREGECIFRYVYIMSGCRKPIKRLWVSSLEESAIKDGFAKLKGGAEYDNLYAAGYSRAKADWLVGMNGSRLFTLRYGSKLNLGRVQTPTLAMIVKRDHDVKNFVKQKYYTVELNCGSFVASSEKIDDEAAAADLISKVNGKNAIAVEVKEENKTVNPPKLYDLTTLQREANKQYGYTAKQTLDYLQALYEAKLSTYPRTDSQFLSDDMEQTAINMVKNVYSIFTEFGNVPENIDVKRCINNKKVSGHHAILPTEKIVGTDLSTLPDGQKNILMLISAKLILAASVPHVYGSVKITVECESASFSATGKNIIDNGWKAIEEKVQSVLKSKNTDEDEKENIISLPEITKGQVFENVSSAKNEHWTSPPKPYTENTLLSAMEHAGMENYDDDTEKKGLGTPATRAGIIEGLVTNGYAQRKGKQITATEKGVKLINVIPEEVKSPKLTADWEMQLQQIEHGKYSSNDFMNGIESFIKDICYKYGSTDTSTEFSAPSNSLGTCPKCGSDVKNGKFGFYCTGKCGMYLAKVYGKDLTETQLKNLLSGKQISYTANGKKTIVLPECVENTYNGKTNYQWKTKKG